MKDIDLAVSLLQVALCPNCEGSGNIAIVMEGIEPGCCGQALENGECCGNAVPVQCWVQEIEQCQWCSERIELISKYEI